MDKETHTWSVLCPDASCVVAAVESRAHLDQWEGRLTQTLGTGERVDQWEGRLTQTLGTGERLDQWSGHLTQTLGTGERLDQWEGRLASLTPLELL